MPPTTVEASPEARPLRTIALITAIFALVQAALGGMVLSGGGGIKKYHGYVGYGVLVLALIAAFFAWKYSQRTGNKGIFMHGLSLPVLALIQIALGEMDVKWVHVVCGILFLIAAFGLYVMADRPVHREPDADLP